MLREALFALDRGISAGTGSLLTDRPGLMTLLFHKVFTDNAEISREQVSPQERSTVDVFRHLFDYYLGLGYQFVSVDQVLRGLDPRGNHILLSFDDGYANNRRILPVLKEYRIPAVFFIATGYVGADTAYWWDAVYRARMREGTWTTYSSAQRVAMHALLRTEAEARVREDYGADALASVGELDRSMTEAELRAFAQEGLVTIGNHTVDHTLLTTLPPDAIHAQIADAQNFLERVTGLRPRAIAYPYGDSSPAVTGIAEASGLELGLTCNAHRNSLPIGQGDFLNLGRFEIIADEAFLGRCHESRLSFSVSKFARSIARQLQIGGRRSGHAPARSS
jgi:peptidoglycan/xylan/chitin deacetylase (PgdA/CDA1 family)